jgi:hypothetical protein
MRAPPMRIIDHMIIIQMFAIGSTGRYLDPLAPPQIQRLFSKIIENVTKRPFLGQDGSNARATAVHFRQSIYVTRTCY